MNETWRLKAPCRTFEKKWFYPDLQSGQYPDIEMITRLCGMCPVRNECLDYAMQRPGELGFWGGTTQGMRQALRELEPFDHSWKLTEVFAAADRIKEYTYDSGSMLVV